MHIFAYNLSMVRPKITKLVSLDSVHHAESNHVQFYQISHFGHQPCLIFFVKMLYFTNALTYCYKTQYVSLAPCPDVLKMFGDSATLWSKVIMKFKKMLITLAYISLF